MDNKKVATIHIETDLDCKVYLYGKELTVVYCGEYSIIKLPLGNHNLSFIGIESPHDCYDIVHTVNNVDFEDFISVRLRSKYNERKKLESKIEEKHGAKKQREKFIRDLKRFIKTPLFKTMGVVILIVLLIISTIVKTGVIYGTYSEGYLAIAEVNIWGGNAKWGYIDRYNNLSIPYKYDYAGSFSEGIAVVGIDKKYAFINQSGRKITQFKYDYADSFSEGLAAVGINGKFGYINRTGREIIPLKYNYASDFSEGLAPVKLNDKFGYINKDGEVIIPFNYDYAWHFKDGCAQVELDEHIFYIDSIGNEYVSRFKNTKINMESLINSK